MSGITQDAREGGITTALGEDTLVLSRLTGEEKLGRCYLFHVELLSEDHDIDFSAIVGQPATVNIDSESNETRFFHGIMTSLRLVGPDREGNAKYSAEIRPWLWLLTRTSNCRIFQNKTVPDIIKEVFDDRGFNDYKVDLERSYPEWEYCVQYRETDFNFVSRLMEQEGIYYYFNHSDGKSEMVLTDSLAGHEAVGGDGSIPFSEVSDGAVAGECISSWSVGRAVRSGKFTLNDYDFTKPKTDLFVDSELGLETDRSEYEVYDYPGEYIEKSEGDALSRIRREELQADYEVASAKSDCRLVCPGKLFGFTDYGREDQNKEHLITEARYMLRMPDSGGSAGGTTGEYSVTFKAIDSQHPFRSARITPKPAIQGPQTAMVVGPSGEEIHTDEYARVKLHFHWDRLGQKDADSSCWVRVSQAWAGPNWGSIHIPRIGQEVIVEFLEGDPDRPIVTGRVYNADNMAPYELPANMTQSGIKSRSSKGGSPDNFNELRFEDKKGQEEIYFHAEKDYNRVVENNETALVGVDREVTVKNDENLTIENDQNIEVMNNQTVKIGVDQTESIGSNETRDIGSDRKVTVGANQSHDVGADRSTSVGGSDTLSVGSNRAVDVGANEDVSVGGSKTLAVTGSTDIDGKGKVTITSMAGITLKCMGSSITIDAKGIAIKGPKVDVKGDMTLKMKGGLTTKVEGGLKIDMKGGLAAGLKSGLKTDVKSNLMTSLKSSVMAKVKGSITKIN